MDKKEKKRISPSSLYEIEDFDEIDEVVFSRRDLSELGHWLRNDGWCISSQWGGGYLLKKDVLNYKMIEHGFCQVNGLSEEKYWCLLCLVFFDRKRNWTHGQRRKVMWKDNEYKDEQDEQLEC